MPIIVLEETVTFRSLSFNTFKDLSLHIPNQPGLTMNNLVRVVDLSFVKTS